MQQRNNVKIAIIGLGYVGLPLAVELAFNYKVTGFDIDTERVFNLQKYIDHTQSVESKTLQDAITLSNKADTGLCITDIEKNISDCNVYIITVPTPVNKNKQPDLSLCFAATKSVAKFLHKNDTVIYESTVYPGCTEEECIPILEKESGLKINTDFWVGYSPERINPGDKIHTLANIKKITSGSSPEAAAFVDELYASIIQAGTYKAPSIKVAEAAKAIENAQRDVNISFINELALIFDKMNIDTNDVLEAAATKWNFLPFKPGLVGGHCIGVDPYYLLYKSKELGYTPQVILSGREVNEQMGNFIANKVNSLIKKKGNTNNNILVLGFTFKENCTDIRNTGVIHLAEGLSNVGFEIDIYDPLADAQKVKQEYNLTLLPELKNEKEYAAVVHAVAHDVFKNIDFNNWKNNKTIIFDVKGTLDKNLVDGRL
ncbi:MAG: nucleotide sugar dehydrogenase [Arachidicoccus sp.]|nr:nucleotide sugar dehydrogenase [Arachidicoccus sp.]